MIDTILKNEESRTELENKLLDQGFENCLKFLKLVKYLNPASRKSELNGWECMMRNNPDGQRIYEIVKRETIGIYKESYQELMALANQHQHIEFVNRVSGYLSLEYEEFMSQFHQ